MPSGLVKLRYKGKEEKIFYDNPQINYYKKIFKRHVNYAKNVVENEFFNRSEGKTTFPNTNVSLSELNVHFIKNLYLEINLYEYNNNFDLNKLFEKIELKCSDYIINILTPEVINIQSNIYYDSSNYNLIKSLYDSNHRNKYFIPLFFPALMKNYIPIYLLYKEDVYLRFYFKQNYNITKISLISEGIIIDDIRIFNSKNYMWFTEDINYIENKELNTYKEEVKLQKIELKNHFSKITKSLLFTLNGGSIDKIVLRCDNHVFNLNSKLLQYINLYQTNLNYNSFNSLDYGLYLIPFSLFKENISGFVNFNQLNNCSIELCPKKLNTNMYFYKVLKFEDQKFDFYVDTALRTVGKYSPIIYIFYNIIYYLNNINTNINVTTDLQTKITYSGFSKENKTLIIVDSEITKLYYYDLDTNDVTPGIIEISSLDLQNSGKAYINIYNLNYDLYNINNGQLFPLNIEL